MTRPNSEQRFSRRRPALSNSSAGSVSSRASTPTRTVRFQDQVESRSSNQRYAASGRGRWQGNQSPQGNGNNQRPWAGQRPRGQRPPSPRPPSPGQSGPRPVPSPSERQWEAGQGAARLRPPAPPNTGNWRPGWRSPTGDGNRPPPVQPELASTATLGSELWLSRVWTARLPQCVSWTECCVATGTPGLRCFVCGQWGCHSSRHQVGPPPLISSTQGQAPSQSQRPAPVVANQQSNWQRGSTQGERVPPASPRPQSN